MESIALQEMKTWQHVIFITNNVFVKFFLRWELEPGSFIIKARWFEGELKKIFQVNNPISFCLFDHLLENLSRSHGIPERRVSFLDGDFVTVSHGVQRTVDLHCRPLRRGSLHENERSIQNGCINDDILDGKTIETRHLSVQKAHIQPLVVSHQDGRSNVLEEAR